MNDRGEASFDLVYSPSLTTTWRPLSSPFLLALNVIPIRWVPPLRLGCCLRPIVMTWVTLTPHQASRWQFTYSWSSACHLESIRAKSALLGPIRTNLIFLRPDWPVWTNLGFLRPDVQSEQILTFWVNACCNPNIFGEIFENLSVYKAQFFGNFHLALPPIVRGPAVKHSEVKNPEASTRLPFLEKVLVQGVFRIGGRRHWNIEMSKLSMLSTIFQSCYLLQKTSFPPQTYSLITV